MEPLRILIAEDEAVIALLMGEVLAGLGHSICAITATEDETVSAAAQYRPDLIIIDEGLQEGDGVSAMRSILASGAIPHVFTTGNMAGVLARRPDAIVIEKPFHETDLVRAIARACLTPSSTQPTPPA